VGRIVSARRQRGVSLLEVLIAIVVFSVGVLGLALMQLKGASFTKQSGTRAAAIMQTRSLADAMRGNPAATLPYASVPTCPYCYDGAATLTPVDCATTACSAIDTATNDLIAWKKQLALAAPTATTGVQATVVWSAALGAYVITASWYDGGLKKDSTAEGDQSYSFTYVP
jgi:type IV pilus assembly protein PilV